MLCTSTNDENTSENQITNVSNKTFSAGSDDEEDDFLASQKTRSVEEIYRQGSKIQGRNGSALMAKVLQVNDPRSYEEARGKKEWEQAMEEEYDALVKNKTWELGKNVIGRKWVYKTKFKSDNVIEKYEARLVANGFDQKEGVDYEETFAGVIKMNTIKIILSLAASLWWHIHQMDVKNAFLNGDLYEEIYMDQPPGFVDHQHLNLVCTLKKSQAP